MCFIYVKYHKKKYPEDITPDLVEVAGHFDKDKIDEAENYSLHTEYSYGKRKFSSELIKKYPELCEANKKEIPQLWKSKKWAEEFAHFVSIYEKGTYTQAIVFILTEAPELYTQMTSFIKNL